VQVFLYLLTVIGFFFLLRELFPNQNLILIALITLLFLAHPIHTEVVANVKSRDEILALLFSVLGLWALMKADKHPGLVWSIGAGVSFFLGCMSKETAITMMAIAPLTLWVFTKKSLREVALQSAPAWVAGIVYLLIRTAILEPETANFVADPFINNSLLAAETTSERMATNILLLGKYVNLLIFPHPLSFDYSFQQIPITGWGNIQVWFSLLVYLALIGVGVYGVMKRKIGGYLALFYLATISIVSHIFVPIAATMAERFLFMPSVAFCIALGLGLWFLGEKYGKSLSFNPAIAVLGLIFIAYAVKTYSQLPVWQSNETLFAHGVEVAPNSFRTHLNLAEITRAKAEATPDPNINKPLFEKAISHYETSLGMYKNNPTTWYNLGVCYFGINNVYTAIKAYEETLKRDPSYFNAANNLGVIYFRNQDYDKALQYFQMVVNLRPDAADGHANIGAIYHNQGNFAMAINHYEKALSIDPNNRNVLGNMVKLYQTLGDAERAAVYQRRLN
jgi:cytochrome c-type biogenesis protein CcmH/NrfG